MLCSLIQRRETRKPLLRGFVGDVSLPVRLLVASAVGYAFVFSALVAVGRPGLGVGQGFYVPIILAALATGPVTGAAAGALALVLYVAALSLASHPSATDALRLPLDARLISYVAAGITVGYFAGRARRMMSDALQVLDELMVLARRDAETGAATGGGFQAAVDRLVLARTPFVVLVGEMLREPRRLPLRQDDRELREIVAVIAAHLGPDDELARVGSTQIGIAAPGRTNTWAQEASARMEHLLAASGHGFVFGWAAHPGEGDDALSLFQVANERLYARRVVRAE
jgi:GGDEF domain-containing protein